MTQLMAKWRQWRKERKQLRNEEAPRTDWLPGSSTANRDGILTEEDLAQLQEIIDRRKRAFPAEPEA